MAGSARPTFKAGRTTTNQPGSTVTETFSEQEKTMKMLLPFIALLSIASTLCRAADAPMASSLQRSLVVARQGYFPVAIRLADGRTTQSKEHPEWSVHCGALTYPAP